MSAPRSHTHTRTHMHMHTHMNTHMRAAKVAPTKQQELLRLVSALSGACRADGNVLKNAQLVDLLESQAKAILQSRRGKKKAKQQQQQQQQQGLKQPRRTSAASSGVDAPTISPQRSKLIKKLADANGASDKSSSSSGGGASKRRKLSFETETQQRAGSPLKALMPSSRAFSKASSPSSSSSSSVMDGVDFGGKDLGATAMPHDKSETFASAAARSTPLSVFRADVVDHMLQRSSSGGVSPHPFYKARAAFKSLDEVSVGGIGISGVDLSASMASTVASTSAGYYDDLYDDLSDSRYGRGAHSPGMDSRGRRTPLSELTQSVDSIDWSPSDDEDEDEDELLAHGKHNAESPSSSASAAAAVMGFSSSYAGYTEGESELEPTMAAALDVPCATASSTEAVMQVLYGILRQDAKYKWLVDPSNQARVAKLVAFHQREQQQQQEEENEVSASASMSENQEQSQSQQSQHDTSGAAQSIASSAELRAQVDALVRENARLVAANEMSACDVEAQQQRVDELLAQLRTATSAIQAATTATTAESKPVSVAPQSDNESHLAATQQQLAAQESMRREAEAAFAAQLRAKSESVAALQQDVAAKDSEVARLMAQVESMSGAFVTARPNSPSSVDGVMASMPMSDARRLSLSAQKTPLCVESADGSNVGGAVVIEPAARDAAESMILHLREVNVAREGEVQRLRGVLAAKDREICALYMQLSTKKTLVDELARRLAQELQALAAARGESSSSLAASVPSTALVAALDVDTFLFASAVAKQQSVDELTAALGVMEREVETLETRVETLESENYRLTVTHEDATCTLESANAELLRVSAENELMESSLKDKQTRIRNLMLYLEEKEEQIMRLKDAAEQQLGLVPRTY